MTDRELVAELVAIRQERGLTQKDVGDRIGVGRSAVCLFETRQERSPMLVSVLRYAEAVGADLLVVRLTECRDRSDGGALCVLPAGHPMGWHEDANGWTWMGQR